MPDNPRALNSIVIIGGGTAGWMAASLLAPILQGSNTRITLIESPDIGIIGVGEATVPSFMAFLKTARINEREFIEATAGTFKLGIRFDHWLNNTHSFFHPFGKIGRVIDGHEFYQVWLKTLANGYPTRWMEHSPAAIMAEHNRFMLETQLQNTPLANYGYALHLDAVLAARYLRRLSTARGVGHIEARVERVMTDQRQFIQAVELTNGQLVTGDFFIDCTGFKGLLIEEALRVGYESWENYLPCNRAVAVQTENHGEPSPFTIATAREAGWTWKIPLQHRTGNGYVFASDYCSDDEAVHTLLNAIDGKALNPPRIIPFVTGKRKKIWHNNCLSLGLAAGFLEPLESTAIHLVYRTLVHFIRNYPDRDFDEQLEQQFNREVDNEYLEIRDFIILHYCTTQRDDTDFWRRCKTMAIPDALEEKINRFRQRGQLRHHPENLFGQDSWCSILDGMGVRPQKYHPLADVLDSKKLAQSLNQGARAIYDTAIKLPTHGEFIKRYCTMENHE